MILLAELTVLAKVLILALAGWLIFRSLCRRNEACQRGGGLRFLGLVAIIAGIAFFLTRSDRPAHVEDSRPTVFNTFADDDSLFDDGSGVVADPLAVKPDRWVFIVLGTALVILGSLVFGRGRTRPVALRAVTFLGVAAILYAVVTFFGQPPRGSRHDARMVSVERRREAELEARQAATRALESPRPDRPDALPPRAGEIPVSAELAREASAPEPAVDAAPPSSESPVNETPNETEKQPAPAESKVAESAKPAEAKPVADEPHTAAITISEQPRPEWVDAPAGLAGNGVYAMVVPSGILVSVPECQRELELAMKRTADNYIDDYLGEGASEVVGIPISFLNAHVKKAEYVEVVQSKTVGTMHQLYARLEFDNQVRSEFHRRRHQAEVADRLWYAGGGAALVLALLGALYGYLTLDLRTGGAHKGRLQLAATLVALLAAASVLLVRWAVPF